MTKKDVGAIKGLEEPGLALVGFKPRACLKAKLNYRTSYFLYPDEDTVAGSSAFFDALLK
jgi:hypothetical protein